jgi:hypothetical protein
MGAGFASGLRPVIAVVCTAVAMLVGAAPAHAAFGYLGQIGTAGPAGGQFFNVRGVAADAAGNVYLADTGNLRIQKLDPAGNFVAAWGWGVQDGASAYQVCTAGCRSGLAGSGDGQFDKPIDVAVDGAGNVYVLEGHYPNPSFASNERVQKFDSAGNFLTKWGSPGSADGEFNVPGGVAADPAGNVYVSDERNHRVQKFDSTGAFLLKWGSEGFGAGQFRGLSGIATDSGGNVYTLEGGYGGSNHRVQKFDSSGNPQSQFDAIPGDGLLTGIDVDSSGFVYVVGRTSTEEYNSVRRFDSTGALADKVGCPGSMDGVGTSPSGKVYVSVESGLLIFGEGGNPCLNAPTPLVFGGTEGVTINAGALYTNDPSVRLTVAPPGNATEVLIANDGGFSEPIDTGTCSGPGTCRRAIAADNLYDWELQPAADERLPKTVYARFANASGTSATTFTDDIILDTVPPTVPAASLSPAPVSGGSARAAAAKRRRFILRVRARDNASGVGKMQLAVKKRKPGRLIRYRRKLALRAARPPRFVRVRDRAGNFSKWRRIKSR